MNNPAIVNEAIKLMNKILPFVSGMNERKEVVKMAIVIANKKANNLGFNSIVYQ